MSANLSFTSHSSSPTSASSALPRSLTPHDSACASHNEPPTEIRTTAYPSSAHLYCGGGSNVSEGGSAEGFAGRTCPGSMTTSPGPWPRRERGGWRVALGARGRMGAEGRATEVWSAILSPSQIVPWCEYIVYGIRERSAGAATAVVLFYVGLWLSWCLGFWLFLTHTQR